MSIRGRQRLVTTKCNRNYEVKQLVKRGEFNMRKLLSLILVLILLAVIITGCAGGKSHTAAPSEANNQNQTEAGSTQNAPAENGGKSTQQGKSTVSAGYNAYKQARDAFDQYTLEQSARSEVFATNYPLVCAFELEVFEYVLPLVFIGESINSTGRYNEAMETTMLQTGWADDAKLTDNGDGSFLVTGTSSDGGAMSVRIEYDPDRDDLRLEAQKDGESALLFEYAKNGGGYAAQYYFKAITGHDFSGAKEQMCVYRTIFDGQNGSCARFDGIDAEPETLLGGVPSEEDFISGATHWFTIANGEFTGNLNGKAF